MDKKMYDLIIVGGGPAGITAAIYAARSKLNFIMLSDNIGGQVAASGLIENYTGYGSIPGPQLCNIFEDHLKKFSPEIKEYEKALSIVKEGDLVHVTTSASNYYAIATIIATGCKYKKLNVTGEDSFANRGVSYCATCDAPLFGGKRVAVVGGGNSALDAASQLSAVADHVYVINKNAAMKGDATTFQKVKEMRNVTFLYEAQTKAIVGDKVVQGIEIEQLGERKFIALEGVFIKIGNLPNSQFINIVEKTATGEIIVNAKNETSVEGIFAAGDVTNVSEKQIVIASGEGSKALLSAFKYIIAKR